MQMLQLKIKRKTINGWVDADPFSFRIENDKYNQGESLAKMREYEEACVISGYGSEKANAAHLKAMMNRQYILFANQNPELAQAFGQTFKPVVQEVMVGDLIAEGENGEQKTIPPALREFVSRLLTIDSNVANWKFSTEMVDVDAETIGQCLGFNMNLAPLGDEEDQEDE